MVAHDAILETGRLLARSATAADTEFIYQLWTNPRVMANVGFPQGLRVERAQVLADIEAQQGGDEFGRTLIIVHKESGRVIGQCKLGRPNKGGIAETDVKLHPQFWGHRYGVEIKRALVEYLFTHTNCTAVQATPNVKNIASIKMQEAVGGVRVAEGVFEFPAHMQEYTAPVNHYVYRVYRATWEKTR